MKTITTLFVILTLATGAFSQVKLPKVTKEDLRQSVHKIDSTAEAAYMFRGVRVEYNFKGNSQELNLIYKFRIKIFESSGEDYAEFSIPLYSSGSDDEEIRKVKAVTYNLEGDKIVETKLEKRDIYEEKTADYLRQIKFAMPNVKPGSIIDVNYTVYSPFLYTIPKWYFQSWIPVDYSRFELLAPRPFSLTPIASGLIPLESKEEQVLTSWGKTNMLSYEVKDVPAIKEDEYVLNENDYRTGIKYEIYSLTYNTGEVEYFSKDWKTIGNNLLESKYFGSQVDQKLKDLNDVVDGVKSLSSEKEKAQYIYDYIIQNFRWNKEYGIFVDNGIKNLIKTGSGNVAEINLLLTNLLNKAGIAARPMLTKYRFNGILNPYYPSRSELNYVFVSADIDGKEIYMDASSQYLPMGTIPIRSLNIYALKVQKDASNVVNMSNNNLYQSVQMHNINLDEEDDCLMVDSHTRLAKYASTKFRINASEFENEEDNQNVENVNYGDDDLEEEDEEYEEIREDVFEIDTVEGFEDIYKPVSYSSHEIKYNTHKRLGNKIFINASFGYGLDENPFEEKSREFPVFYNQLSKIRRIINFEIPEGYKLASYPEKLSIGTSNKKISFIYDPKVLDNKLSITYYLHIGSDVILPTEYSDIVDIYDKIIAKQEEQIVLEKI